MSGVSVDVEYRTGHPYVKHRYALTEPLQRVKAFRLGCADGWHAGTDEAAAGAWILVEGLSSRIILNSWQ